MTKEALTLALECAERCRAIDGMYSWSATITAIKESLAKLEQCTYPDCNYPCMNLPDCKQPEQEPVAWRETHSKIIKALAAIVTVHTPDKLFDLDAIPRDPVMHLVQQIKAAIDGYKPPQRTWVGLTDREKSNLWLESRAAIPRFHTYATLVEAKLKEKNHEWLA